MAKHIKNKKPVSQANKSNLRIHRYLIALPVIAFLIKMIVMSNIETGGWLGADGENYVAGINGLLKDGFFSNEPKLSYWPAGYPLLLWPFAKLSLTNFYYFLSFIQTIFFGYATYFLTNQLRKTKFAYLAIFASLLISLNPTMSLSTLAVGYEAPIAACMMMVVGILIANYPTASLKNSLVAASKASGWFALAIFMQPRFLLVGIVVLAFWTFRIGTKRNVLLTLALSVLIMAITPTIMIYRNTQVINQATISTNLGVTMAIGAGESTKGGYDHTGPEVPCEPIKPSKATTDSEKIKCVIKWYLQNPLKTLKLSFNKSQFFWSPWSGPLVNGTMARNPWLKISPTESIGKSHDGAKLIMGNFGKGISYLWIIGQILFLFWGYREIRGLGDSEKVYSRLLLIPVALSWLTSIGTIGDHRFRIPTMTLSLLLQAAGMLALKNKIIRVLWRQK